MKLLTFKNLKYYLVVADDPLIYFHAWNNVILKLGAINASSLLNFDRFGFLTLVVSLRWTNEHLENLKYSIEGYTLWFLDDLLLRKIISVVIFLLLLLLVSKQNQIIIGANSVATITIRYLKLDSRSRSSNSNNYIQHYYCFLLTSLQHFSMYQELAKMTSVTKTSTTSSSKLMHTYFNESSSRI